VTHALTLFGMPGRTPGSAAHQYTVGDVLADVLALLEALGLRRVGLVAHADSVFVGFRLCLSNQRRAGRGATTR
jgi:hypothetical protein